MEVRGEVGGGGGWGKWQEKGVRGERTGYMKRPHNRGPAVAASAAFRLGSTGFCGRVRKTCGNINMNLLWPQCLNCQTEECSYYFKVIRLLMLHALFRRTNNLPCNRLCKYGSKTV